MRKLSEYSVRLHESPYLCAAIYSIMILMLLYPDIFILKNFFPGAKTWELQDWIVSPLNFVPSVQTVRYELFTNFNLLWSNLKWTGMPLLGNDIQAAPLFPLTLICIWIPDPYFWNVYILIRIFLVGFFSFIIARKNLGFSSTGAVIFMICLAFSVHVLRWSNHPWQNGLLAGLIYIHFIYNYFEGTRNRPVTIRNGLGVITGVYCMVTSGFPESTLMMAILALFLFVPELVARSRIPGFQHIVLGIILFHLIGFCISSPQLLALCDFIGKEALHYRPGHGAIQYTDYSIFLRWFTRVRNDTPGGEAIHFFNTIPFYLFLIGITCLKIRKTWHPVTIGLLFSSIFFVIKNFPIWPAFNEWISRLPIASASLFNSYSLVLILFPFAYFVALGAEHLVSQHNRDESGLRNDFVLGAGVAISPLFIAAGLYYFMGYTEVEIKWVYKIGGIFMFFCFILYLVKNTYIPIVLCLFILIELCVVLPRDFIKIDSQEYERSFSHSRPKQLLILLESRGWTKENVREISGPGSYVSSGIASFNSGSMPIIPYRLKNGLTTFFKDTTGWGAHMPVTVQSLPFVWQMMGVTHYLGNSPTSEKSGDTRSLRLVGDVAGEPVFEDIYALGRAYIAQKCTSARDPDESMRIITAQDQFRAGDAVIESLDTDLNKFCNSYSNRVQRIAVEEDRGASVKLSVVRGPGIVILNDQYFQGWNLRNSIDGEILKIHPANYMFRGAVLEKEKDYRLEFFYRPTWLNYATTLVSSGFILMLGWLVYMFVGYKIK